MKKSEILQELTQCGIETEGEDAVAKMVPTDVLHTGLPQTFNL